MEGVSIVVCCYNSATRLPETIRSIAYQVVDEVPWEVIIVNNNSTDNTKERAMVEWAKYKKNTPFVVVDENKPGLSNARERGIEVSKYEFILFCDDDNWLGPNYIKRGYNILRTHKEIGALGGKGIEVLEKEPPAWFNKIRTSIALDKQAYSSGEVDSSRRYVYGAGMFLRKSAWVFIKSKGFKSLVSDRKGDVLISGGDNEICFCLSIAGYKIWYDDSLIFKHYMPSRRLEWSYTIRLFIGFGVSSFLLRPYYNYFQNVKREVTRATWIRDLIYVIRKNFMPDLIKLLVLKRKTEEWYYAYLQLVSTTSFLKSYLYNYKFYKNNVEYLSLFSENLRKVSGQNSL